MPSLWRPFSFFRAMVRRPFLERMRTRKPCVWCLFTVDGWYVRFTASIGAAAKEERRRRRVNLESGWWPHMDALHACSGGHDEVERYRCLQ